MDDSRRSGPTPTSTTHRRRSARLALVGVFALMATVAVACTEPPPPPAPVNWYFEGAALRVNDVQDEVCAIVCVNTSDEAYLYQIAFRVKIGEPGSAQTWVIKGDETPGIGKNGVRALVGGERARANFPNIQPLDVVSALDPANKLEIFGTYTWAAESDVINSLGPSANTVASVLQNSLNQTLAGSQLPTGDTGGLVSNIVSLLFNNATSAFKLLVSNLPCAGLCDDVLGGAVYVGIGVTGTLAQAVNSLLAAQVVPPMDMGPGSVPPDVQGGRFFTLGGENSFHQTFTGADGQHQYTFNTAWY